MSPSIRINVTVPEEILNVQSVQESIKSMMRSKTAPALEKYFKGTVDGWEKKPDFSKRFDFTTSRLSTLVFASGSGSDIYALVNAGSPPHIIRAKRVRLLRFQSGYTPSTSPRMLRSKAKSRHGPFVMGPIAHHPGFKAREFDDAISEVYRPTFERDVQEAIDRGSR